MFRWPNGRRASWSATVQARKMGSGLGSKGRCGPLCSAARKRLDGSSAVTVPMRVITPRRELLAAVGHPATLSITGSGMVTDVSRCA